MLIAIIGESCTGKSQLARRLQEKTGADLCTGKDYLRLSGNEASAERLFVSILQEAVSGKDMIYVISEPEQLSFLPEGAVRIVLTADLSFIRERFAERMHGTLPKPVADMLERKHGCFDDISCDLHFDGMFDPDEAVSRIEQMFPETTE